METTSSEMVTSPKAERPLLRGIFRTYLMLAFPVIVTLLSVRIVMAPWFLTFEYTRTWLPIPDDYYGFTTEERLEYAPYAVNYLINDADISYLGDLRFPDGRLMYNDRELRHMEDVKVVTRAAFTLLTALLLLTAALMAYLLRNHESRRTLRDGLLHGSILTLSLIGVIVVSAVVAWDVFFTLFHQLFFEAGTWRFAYSDTLIRLFPERFWFDAAIIIGLMTTTTAVVTLFVMRRWGKRV